MTPNNNQSNKYEVFVDDNYHALMEPNSYKKIYEFDNKEDAINKCEEILIQSLIDLYKEGMSIDEISAIWAMYGEDPFIRAKDCKFSSREFLDTKRDDEDFFLKIKSLANATRK